MSRRSSTGSLVYVCADVDRIEICDRQARRLIEHQRLPEGAGIKLDPPHVRRVRYDVDELALRVGQWGEVARAFAAGVRAHRRCAGAELVRLLQLQIDWSPEDIVAAMEQALAYDCFELARVQRILELRFSPRRFMDSIAEATRRRIHEVMKENPVGQRPIADYEVLQTGDRALEGPAEEEEEDDVSS